MSKNINSVNGQDIKEFHWLMDLLMTIDAGLIVLDKSLNIQLWNSFMRNHSGLADLHVKDKSIFEAFNELDEEWLRHKIESVFLLKNRSFITWEQRPYLFKFKNYRPITGTEPYMYQNIVINPLVSADGSVNHVCLVVYDVTDTVTSKKSLEQSNIKLQTIGRTDSLTQLNNRGYWEERLIAEFDRLNRYSGSCSLVMFDIDHFKKVNDIYGHQAGDEVIRTVARCFTETMRTSDIGGRYGGEEFAAILPNTDAKQAMVFCERLRKQIESTSTLHSGTDVNVTISLGICEFNEEVNSHQNWLENADKALYLSKENGRNQSSACQLN